MFSNTYGAAMWQKQVSLFCVVPEGQHEGQRAAGGGMFLLHWNNWPPFMEKLPTSSSV